MAGSSNIGEAADNPVAINITAMVDVIFCLCLFFMCSLHFKQLQGKIDTWLPKDRGIFQGAASSGIVKDEICVVMSWRNDQTIRNLLHQQPAASDEQLMASILAVAEGYNAAGNTTWPLVIAAEPDVPWQDVVHVMDLCKQNKIERIEFGAPEREITQ